METSAINHKCEHCGQMLHPGVCPTVKAIEYHPDGSIKRIEYKSAADYGSVDIGSWRFSAGSAGHTAKSNT